MLQTFLQQREATPPTIRRGGRQNLFGSAGVLCFRWLDDAAGTAAVWNAQSPPCQAADSFTKPRASSVVSVRMG
jgi:hypothetical protein